MAHPPFKIVFFGTSDFAAPILERLARDERFRLLAVVTQPDRPAGRHAEIKKSPVKRLAEKLGLPVLQFERVKNDEAFENLRGLGADAGVVASFGQIIPPWLLDAYPHGMVNVHGSLLPRWRGASPIQAALNAGDQETGVTIMKMDALLDHGPLLAEAKEPILADDTGGRLHDRLAILGAKILPDALFDFLNGKIQPHEQDHASATTTKLLSREDGKIDWTKSAQEIERLVRAYDPWPGTYTVVKGKRLKILASAVGSRVLNHSRPWMIEESYPAVLCGDGVTLKLLRVQPEGGKEMNGKEFLRGQRAWA